MRERSRAKDSVSQSTCDLTCRDEGGEGDELSFTLCLLALCHPLAQTLELYADRGSKLLPFVP